MQLALLVIAAIAMVAAVVNAYYAMKAHLLTKRMTHNDFEEPPSETMPTKSLRYHTVFTGGLVVVASVFFFLFLVTRHKVPNDSGPPFGFESGTMGWMHQTFPDTQGIIAVDRSRDRAKLGKYSLKLTADLDGGDPNRGRGEAYVEIPVQSLENKPITVWVYVPGQAIGDPMRPNGIHVFVQDAAWRSEYGTWLNITRGRTDAWLQVTLTPSKTQPPDGYMEEGFDPTQIRTVGVNIAIGDGSEARYEGPIYIDAVGW